MNKLSNNISFAAIALAISFASCNNSNNTDKKDTASSKQDSSSMEYGSDISVQEPLATEPIDKYAKIVGWDEGEMPQVPAGYKVVKFAEGLNSPRNIYVAANGDIFVAQARTPSEGKSAEKVAARNLNKDANPNEVLLFKDNDGDGKADEQTTFLKDLNLPYGMLILGDHFYVGNTDALVRYPYNAKQGKLTSTNGKSIVKLPAGGYNNHWTRNIITNKAQDKILISVGSGSNVGENGMEHEVRRANILEVNPDGSGERVYASGIRNPVGMDWESNSGKLWTAVNERDQLGDELVPDYITSVQSEKFYGWPYYYWGMHIDPRWKDKMPKDLAKSVTPDYAVGAHTASLGLAFNKAPNFETGVFIGQHGSWNRSEFVGYKVAFVPFKDGKPSGKMQDFLTGFIANKEKGEVHGRPVGIAFTKNYMLVADDAANVIWAVVPDRSK